MARDELGQLWRVWHTGCAGGCTWECCDRCHRACGDCTGCDSTCECQAHPDRIAW